MTHYPRLSTSGRVIHQLFGLKKRFKSNSSQLPQLCQLPQKNALRFLTTHSKPWFQIPTTLKSDARREVEWISVEMERHVVSGSTMVMTENTVLMFNSVGPSEEWRTMRQEDDWLESGSPLLAFPKTQNGLKKVMRDTWKSFQSLLIRFRMTTNSLKLVNLTGDTTTSKVNSSNGRASIALNGPNQRRLTDQELSSKCS